ncbi:hypothetical protein Tco_1340609 [Tanacetum coccineum]
MLNLDHDPSILTGRPPISMRQEPPLLSKFVAPNGQNLHESNTVQERDMLALPINLHDMKKTTPSSAIATKRHAQFQYYKKIWKLIFTVALFAMFPSLAQVGQLKFTNTSPFVTHVFFSNMGVIAYVIAIPTSVIFFAMANYLEGLANEPSSRTYYIYMILRCVFCFSAILAPLSFVLVLLIPNDGYYWIGYLIISLIFAVIVTYNVIDYLRCKIKLSDLSNFQRDKEILSPSIV